MANEMVELGKSSSKANSKYKGDLTKNVDQVCVWYHLSGPWESDNGLSDAGSDTWDWTPEVIEGH